MSVLFVAVIAAAAGAIVDAQRSARRELRERFDLRADIAAEFIDNYATSVLDSERARAEALLGAATVRDEDFLAIVQAYQFEAAVVLDREGRLLAVHPANPEILGDDLASRYPHLGSALAGEPAVSNVVPSAARGEAVVAFATPYDSVRGTRVFSGADRVAETPFPAYLQTLLPFPSARAYLVDGSGTIIASSNDRLTGPLGTVDPELATAASSATSGTYANASAEMHFARHQVGSTQWQLLLTVPTSVLYSPLEGPSSWVPWLLFAALVLTVGGLLTMGVIDVVRRRQLAELNGELQAQSARLQALTDTQQAFIGITSHELIAPLTVISGYASLLGDGLKAHLTPDEERYFDVIQFQTLRMESLINDLLTVHELDTGHFELVRSSLDVVALSAEAVEAAAPQASAAGVGLRLVEPEESLPHVLVDRHRLHQVFSNLIGNALKFTPPGGHIDVGARRDPHGAAELFVADSGSGISADELPHVFERFYRSDNIEKKRAKGTGLGLYLSKVIVEAHGGTISVASNEGHGTTFVVRLPEPPTPPQEVHKPTDVAASGHRPAS